MTPEDRDSGDWIEATVAGMAPTPDHVALKEGMRARIAGGSRPPVLLASSVSRRAVWAWAVGLAAAAAIVFGSVNKWMSPQPIREFANSAGSRSTIVLRDGTRVILGPESKIQVPSDFGAHDRTVQLDGEAYFAVVHDAQHPFAVLTHNVNITDIGTEFDVRGYDDAIRVAVAKGSVVVGAGRGNGDTRCPGCLFNLGTVSRTRPPSPPNTPSSFQDISLFAGDMFDVADGVPTVSHHADIASATAWLQGQLVFKNTPLGEAVRDLARTFDLQITLADTTLAHELVTGAFGDESADFVLDNVTAVVGARYERQGKKVVIERRSGSAMNDKRPVPLNTAQARGA